MIDNKTVTVIRTEKRSFEMNRGDIAAALRALGVALPKDPVEVRIYFAVPGGGDWSNTDIDIDDKNPVRVEWQTTEERDA